MAASSKWTLLKLFKITLGFMCCFTHGLNNSKQITEHEFNHLKFLTYLPDGSIQKSSFIPNMMDLISRIGHFAVDKSSLSIDDHFVDVPYHVAIHKSSGPILICGGVILDEMTVMSAAHCFKRNVEDEKYLDQFLFIFGKNNLLNPEPTQSFNVAQEIFIHEDYDDMFNFNDIAIVHLRRPLIFNDRIQPIKLPLPGTQHTGKAIASGWSQTFVTQYDSKRPIEFSPILKVSLIDVITKDQCNEIVKNNNFLQIFNDDNSLMCTANLEEGVRDSCIGDSGGPLVCRYWDKNNPRYNEKYICGIAATRIGCGGIPGFYTNVQHFLGWINARRPWIKKE